MSEMKRILDYSQFYYMHKREDMLICEANLPKPLSVTMYLQLSDWNESSVSAQLENQKVLRVFLALSGK